MVKTMVVMVMAVTATVAAGTILGQVACATEGDAEDAGSAGTGRDVCCALPSKSEGHATQSASKDAGAPAIPMVCSLTSREARVRLEAVRGLLEKAATKITRASNSVSVEFADGHASEILTFIELERACCPFLSFTLSFPAGKPVELTVTAPQGGEAMLKALFSASD